MTHPDSQPTAVTDSEWTEYVPEGSQAGAPTTLGRRLAARALDLGVWIAVLAVLRSLPLAALWCALWTLAWLVVPLWRGGATAGKRLCRIRITRTDGDRMTLGRAVLREVSVLGSIAVPVIGVLNALTAINDRRHQSLHDKVFDTLVVTR